MSAPVNRLLDWVGATDLYRLSGGNIASRGLRYYRERRVEALHIGTDDVVRARVRGGAGRRYAVTLSWRGKLDAHCECPHPSVFCKHIAATLFALRADGGELLAALAARSPEPAPLTAADLPPDGPRRALMDWATEHAVTDWLAMPLEHFIEALPLGDRVKLRHHTAYVDTVLDLIEPMTAAPRPPKSVRTIIRQQLGRAAQTRGVSRSISAARSWEAPTVPALRVYHAALLELRQALLDAGAWPRPEADRPEQERTLVRFPTMVRLSERVRLNLWRTDERVVEVRFAAEGEITVDTVVGEPWEILNCEAVEAALDALVDPHEATLIAREIATPPWQRALAALAAPFHAPDADDAPEASDAAAPVLGWRLATRKPSALALIALECRPKRGGGWKVKAASGSGRAFALARADHPGDHAGVNALRSDRHGAGEATKDQALITAAVRALVGHPRFFLRESRDAHVTLRGSTASLATRDEGEDFRAGVAIGDRWRSAEQVLVAAEAVPLDHAVLLLDEDRPLAWFADLPPAVGTILEALRKFGDAFPAEASESFLEVAAEAAQRVPVTLSEGLVATSVEASPVPIARLGMAPDGLSLSLVVRPLADRATQSPGLGPEELHGQHLGHWVRATRDIPAERAEALRIWGGLGLELPAAGAPFDALVPFGDGALDLVGAVQDCGIVVEWDTERRAAVTVGRIGAEQVTIAPERRGRAAWFTVGGNAEVDGKHVPLADLLAAIRDGQRYVQVGSDRWAEIEESLAKRLATLARRGDQRLPAAAAAMLAEIEEAGATVTGARAWRATLDRMRAAENLDVIVPSTLCGTLRDYQRDGVRWLARLAHWAPGACLADDMGLGKTVQALALLLLRRDDGPAIVVAPTSVGFNWVREAERFAPSLNVTLLRQPDQFSALAAAAPGDLFVTSYGLATRNLEALQATQWSTLVVDEAQAIKNPSTQRARALHALEPGFALALTGTPVENRAAEIWSLFRLISPGLLGSAKVFRERFSGPIERGSPVAREALAELIRPFVLRRLKRNVEQELPARTEVQLDVTLSDAERKRYDTLRLSALASLGPQPVKDDGTPPQQRRFLVLQALTRLRQIACHAGLIDPEWTGTSSKLAAFERLVEELRDEGHRALVFSQFTRLLAKVRESLDASGVSYRYLDGSTPATQRATEVDAFQQGDGDLFLLSLKAGGTGLNLTGADYVIHLDPWWNPAVEDQATDRAHRIGQDKPVTVYRLIARDTVEDGIVKMHAEKRELAEALLAGTGGTAALSVEQLMALVSGDPTVG